VGFSYGFHLCSIHSDDANQSRTGHPEFSLWHQQWILGALWGDDITAGSVKEMTVAKALPSQQAVECNKKVDFFVPAETEVPLGHEIAFGTLVVFLVCTPVLWLIFWKIRQIQLNSYESRKEELIAQKVEEERHKAKLKELEEAERKASKESRKSSKGQVIRLSAIEDGKPEDLKLAIDDNTGDNKSPRSNPSAIGMAPNAIKDEPEEHLGTGDGNEMTIEEAFRLYDRDNSGTIDVRELRYALEALGMHASRKQVKNILLCYDDNEDATLQMEEFKALVKDVSEFMENEASNDPRGGAIPVQHAISSSK